MKETRKVLAVRHHKAGYDVRTEEVICEGWGTIVMKVAYTSDGDYIGDPRTAYRLCKKMGIAPELISQDRNVCSIGFCEQEQKWYGWSHRAIHGFGIGSTVKRGDCGYRPSDVTALAKEYGEWNDTVEIVDDTTIGVCNEMSANTTAPTTDATDEEYPAFIKPTSIELPTTPVWYGVETGRGEWVAMTTDDAKQMAIDFANGVA